MNLANSLMAIGYPTMMLNVKEEAKLTPLVSTLAYNAGVSSAHDWGLLARLTLC